MTWQLIEIILSTKMTKTKQKWRKKLYGNIKTKPIMKAHNKLFELKWKLKIKNIQNNIIVCTGVSQ